MTIHIREKNPTSRTNPIMLVSGIFSKVFFNESAVQYLSRDSCKTVHSESMWSMSVHNGGNCSEVHGTRYGILWPWYDQFEAQVWLGTDISLVDLVLASINNDLCHVKTRPICSDPAAGYKNWLVTFNLHNEFLPMGQYHGQGLLC